MPVHNDDLFGRTRIVGKGRLYSQTSFIFKFEMSYGFVKGVSGGCSVLLNKLCYPQSAFTHNPGPTVFSIWLKELGNIKFADDWI